MMPWALQYKSPGPEIKLTKQKVEEKQQKGPAFAPPFAGKTVPKPVPYLANPIHEAKVANFVGLTVLLRIMIALQANC